MPKTPKPISNLEAQQADLRRDSAETEKRLAAGMVVGFEGFRVYGFGFRVLVWGLGAQRIGI